MLEKILVCLVLVQSSFAVFDLKSIPYPISNYTQCNMPSPSYICDTWQILSTEERIRMNNQLEYFRKEGFCHCEQCHGKLTGPTFLLVLMPSTVSTSIISELFDEWKNHTLCADVIMVVYLNKTRQIELVTGVKLRRTLTYDCLVLVQSETDDQLLREDVNTSLSTAIASLRQHYFKQDLCRSKIKLHILIPLLVLIGLVVVGVIGIYIRVKGWQRRRLTFRPPYRAPHEPEELYYPGLSMSGGI